MLVKRSFALLLTLTIIVLFMPITKSEPIIDNGKAAEKLSDTELTTVTSIPACEQEYGEICKKDNCLTYSYLVVRGENDPSIVSKEYTVPQDFYVFEDGDYCILDTGSKSIRFFDAEDGTETNSIDIDGIIYAQMLAVNDDTFYVLDIASNSVFEISNHTQRRIKLPMVEDNWFDPSTEVYLPMEFEMAPIVDNMYCVNGDLFVSASVYGTYILNEDTFEVCEPRIQISDDGSSFNIKRGASN